MSDDELHANNIRFNMRGAGHRFKVTHHSLLPFRVVVVVGAVCWYIGVSEYVTSARIKLALYAPDNEVARTSGHGAFQRFDSHIVTLISASAPIWRTAIPSAALIALNPINNGAGATGRAVPLNCLDNYGLLAVTLDFAHFLVPFRVVVI